MVLLAVSGCQELSIGECNVFHGFSGILLMNTKVVYTFFSLLKVLGVGFQVSGARQEGLKPEFKYILGAIYIAQEIVSCKIYP